MFCLTESALAQSVPGGRATLSGRVLLAGAAPAAESIDMSSEPFCRDAQRTRARSQGRIQVGQDNGLAGVVVYVKNAPVTSRTAAQAGGDTRTAVLDQVACMYEPRVLALRVGQPLVVRNSDNLLHNVHVKPTRNPPFNLGQPRAGIEARRTFHTQELGIAVKCDVHDWMEASIAVFEHGFFTVTNADGRFIISDLPAGQYELEAWHPVLGVRTQRARVGTDSPEVTFTFGKT
jgi:plastocyanin